MTPTARDLWRILEPLHAMIYFAPEADHRYTALGLDRVSGYFASRSAALGPVPAPVVVATFYNFNPALVHTALPAAWDTTTPAAVLHARHDAVLHALRRGLGPLAEDVTELTDLATLAATHATHHPHGRPLFAAHAALPWPQDPLPALWHAQTLLREYRGDGHLAALLHEGLSGLEALVLHAATGEIAPEALRRTRGWTTLDWATATDTLRDRGLLRPDGALSPAGTALHTRLEHHTDTMADTPYTALDPHQRERFMTLARPLSRAVIAAGMLPTTR